MRTTRHLLLCLLVYHSILLQIIGKSANPSSHDGCNKMAKTPPRGWNSFDSFGWVVNEEQFLENAEIASKRLLKFGYQYVVVDYLWYRKKVEGSYRDSYGYDVLDSWGRVTPDPRRWPSSKRGKGFTEVAKKVHAMGLKFGIHLMGGISTQAFDSNTPIFDVNKGDAFVENGRKWSARDIGFSKKRCAWMNNGFMSVNTDSMAGKAFLRSLYTQYAEWGVDFGHGLGENLSHVKLDCVFGGDLDINEIMTVSEILRELNRPILLSISPGEHTNVDMASQISKHVNMYRITGDDWDTWNDIEAHFNISSNMADSSLIGANGLCGKSWPDMDMLPLGWLTNSYGNEGPYRKSNLTLHEQRTLMTLWSIVKSPLIFGGDLRMIDNTSFKLITNPTLLEINSFSENNHEFPYIDVSNQHNRSREYGTLVNNYSSICMIMNDSLEKGHTNPPGTTMARAWIATGRRKGDVYLAFFNLNSRTTTISTNIQDLAKAKSILGISVGEKASCKCREVWSGRDFGLVSNRLSIPVVTHGCALFVLNCK